MCLKRKGRALLDQMEIAHATLKGGTALEYPPQILKFLGLAVKRLLLAGSVSFGQVIVGILRQSWGVLGGLRCIFKKLLGGMLVGLVGKHLLLAGL